MSYLALYRRFRPTDFTKVIGQDVIVKTLTNQIKDDKINHAYLFCGARGTGKTSLAKIFAKAVNCLSPIDGSPCHKCSACLALNDPSNIDILEMDAASNNKVENVREIRENVQYPPVQVKYKVYIIDEVHMLTPEAFNALLKTLEEPPKHAIFILATTEPQKLPATILSRCLRFDFRLISTNSLFQLVCDIYDEIGKKYTKEAIMAIAKAGEGSVRDTLSVADLCVSIGKDKLTYEDVLSVLGATDSEKINALLNCVFDGNVGGILSITDELLSLGKSIGVLSKDLAVYVRDLILVKTCDNAKEILALPDDKMAKYIETASKVNESRLLRCLEILTGVENSLKFSNQPRNVLESALIKCAIPENDYNLDALLARIKTLEEKLNSGDFTPKAVVINKTEPEKEKVVEAPKVALRVEPDYEPIPPISEEEPVNEVLPINEVEQVVEIKEVKVESVNTPTQPTAPIAADGKRIWGTVVRKLRGMEGKTILWVATQEMTATLQGNVLYVNVSGESEKKLLLKEENITVIEQIVKTFGDIVVKISDEKNVASQDNSEKVSNYFKDTLTIK